MKPIFRIVANGEDITNHISDELLQLKIVDEAGIYADTLTITLNNTGDRFDTLATGAELQAFLGYERYGKAILSDMGIYTVDEIEVSGPPHVFIIECKAADMRNSLKVPKTRSWRSTNVMTIVSTIASEHGLQPSVSAELATIPIQHRDQTNESDLHFLTRMSKVMGATCKLANGYLLYVKTGTVTSATGKNLPTTQIHSKDAISYRLNSADRNKYQKVLAHWHNDKSGKREPVAIGKGEPVYTLPGVYKDPETAKIAATAKLDALKRGASTGHLKMSPADLNIMAEGNLALQGFPAMLNGNWACTRAEFTLGSGGLSVDVQFQTPNK